MPAILLRCRISRTWCRRPPCARGRACRHSQWSHSRCSNSRDSFPYFQNYSSDVTPLVKGDPSRGRVASHVLADLDSSSLANSTSDQVPQINPDDTHTERTGRSTSIVSLYRPQNRLGGAPRYGRHRRVQATRPRSPPICETAKFLRSCCKTTTWAYNLGKLAYSCHVGLHDLKIYAAQTKRPLARLYFFLPRYLLWTIADIDD